MDYAYSGSQKQSLQKPNAISSDGSLIQSYGIDDNDAQDIDSPGASTNHQLRAKRSHFQEARLHLYDIL
jgi:hypothetical protein